MKQYKVYLCNLDWAKIKDSQKGGVKTDIVFDKTMEYEEFLKLIKNTYLYLVDDDVLKQLDKIKFYIEQSDIKNMLWGKEILKIIGGNDEQI